MRTALIVMVGSLTAAALVLSASLGGSMRYFIAPLQFLVVFILLLASAVGGRKSRSRAVTDPSTQQS